MSRAMFMWLEDARSSGIALDKYGIKERNLYLNNEWLQCRRWFQYRDDQSGPRLVGLTTGPELEDWKLHWDLDEDEFAGDFWEMIENPPLRVPGGWIDD
ncbi:uncharacterized protein ColSpa_05007 [Colletotrichum spaethianum]|uniref:Uncharacterized protein n=1 Tax=Colletotrichum spaethianum TaxID=700344 RepID=A0AA37P5W3_9PEZI|nr:uncharacterized protein ColSpa_05007 [Colletotrichum spaethianum]GKT44826.1 hypothetical protein ColSpa_05007 [Colletotrichum spaethianum]